ncbi:hypothetical protein GCM10011506_48100 [Marivirga lumbricoides]|uniref:Uncharacterized protein n=1 Tax=Marivirga lumbricoides TaxID=1046115 RepID=A0ABQ1NAK5_9BACT|nr:hypothetical protein GCM10011506_48100 [Marivirga lumbricoides]
MGNAVIYEYLLCTAYECSRGGVHGRANADIYRAMERAIANYQGQKKAFENGEPPTWTGSVEELEYQADVEISRVAQNVEGAMLELKRKGVNQEEENKLKELIAVLRSNDVDKGTLDKVIEDAWDLCRKDKK